MKIIERYQVPTGDILVVETQDGRKLETLSLGDYGKDVNIKCDAMGLTREPSPVRHTKLLPLEQKWVVTVSTQFGCSVCCQFCDVWKVGPGTNVSKEDLINQFTTALSLHPEVERSDRINLHYARMGEPTYNYNVIEATDEIKKLCDKLGHKLHPVISTMMPRHNGWLYSFLWDWMDIKNNLMEGEAGLQLSINSTDEAQRRYMFNGNAMNIYEIAQLMAKLPKPKGRKITLNFAVADFIVQAEKLAFLFPPEHFICKLTPMHKTASAIDNNIKTIGDYTTYHPYQELEEDLKRAGYDVLVFIASKEEDLGRITCGNAILSGTRPFDIKG